MTRPVLNLKPLLLILGFWMTLTMVRAYADDWYLSDGKIYRDVLVVKVEDDAVTILHKAGGALVPLDKLPAYLQKKFHYDPVKAKIAAAARAKREAADARALEKEKTEAEKLQEQKAIDDANALQAAQTAVQQKKDLGTGQSQTQSAAPLPQSTN
jgi:hypothetical protein